MPAVTVLDLILIVIVVSAVVSGILQGAVLQLFSFGGFWIGLVAGGAVAPWIARLADASAARTLIAIGAPFLVASLGAAGGRLIGSKLAGGIKKAKLGPVDHAAGGAVSAMATLLAIWIVASMLTNVGIPQIAGPVQESKVVRGLSKVMPPAPEILGDLRRVIGRAGLPQVFAEIEPPAGAPAAPPSAEVARATDAARRSTVKVTGAGCGGISSGSGFVAAPGLVVTNAHVVAGIDEPRIEDSLGRRTAVVVLFDPDFDVAVLRVNRLAGRPLPLARSTIPEGQNGAVLGFPGGGPFTAVGGVVTAEFDAVGRDIYSEDLTTRRVLRLSTEVHPGNSGGPFVRGDGEVAGVIFSASAARRDVGYALHPDEVAKRVDRAADLSQEVDTGRCVNQ